MTAPEFDVDALAAHREALAYLIHESHFHDGRPSCGFPARPGVCIESEELADAVLAYFADPEHGLTVETGLRERIEALADEARGRKQAYPEHPHWSAWDHYESDLRDLLSHGLVCDEPSEDERDWVCNGEPHEYWCEGHDDPARSDDGRTAVELCGTLKAGKAGVSDAETLAAEPGQSVAEPADRVMNPGTQARSGDGRPELTPDPDGVPGSTEPWASGLRGAVDDDWLVETREAIRLRNEHDDALADFHRASDRYLAVRENLLDADPNPHWTERLCRILAARLRHDDGEADR